MDCRPPETFYACPSPFKWRHLEPEIIINWLRVSDTAERSQVVVYPHLADNCLASKTDENMPPDTLVSGGVPMIPPPVYYQRAILGGLWLCIMLPAGWPRHSTASHPKPPAPVPGQCKRQRSNEPKVCEGLTHRPPCAVCAHDAPQAQASSPRRPDPMPPGPPRGLDPSRHFCPLGGGDERGGRGRNTRRATGPPRGGPWRPWQGTSWAGYCLETHGTLGPGQRVAVALLGRGGRVWPKAWACAPRPEWVRWPPTPSGHGWGKPPSHSRPFPPPCAVPRPSTRGSSTSCTPWCAASKRARAAHSKPSNARSVPALGCGRPAILRARCGGPSRAAHGPGRWPDGWGQHVGQRCAPRGGPAGGRAGGTGYRPALVGPGGSWDPRTRRHATGPRPPPRWLPRPGRGRHRASHRTGGSVASGGNPGWCAARWERLPRS